MIVGVGTDIIEIKRIEKAMEKESFLRKNFTEKELQMFKEKNMRGETVAGNFAAKEAVSKALGTGFSGFSAIDIEVLRDENNKPYAILNQKAKKAVNINLSISHCKEYAVAFAVAEEEL